MILKEIKQYIRSFNKTNHSPLKIDTLHIRKSVLFIFLLLAQYACINEEVCEDIATVPLRMGFFEENATGDEPIAITLDSLTVFGFGNDSLIYNNQFSVSQIELPLDSQRDSCAFIFVLPQVNSEILLYDTVWFFYDRKATLISMECGFSTFYELNNITFSKNRIDSLSLDNSNIRNTLDEHVKIFPGNITTDTE
jgi:hypothetical protein